MKVYITYDRYEHNEFFQIYSIETERDVAVDLYLHANLPDFIAYGPDDCHQFQLVEFETTEEMYEKLVLWAKTEGGCDAGRCSNSEFYQFMCDLYDKYDLVTCLFSTDGASEFPEIVRYYALYYKNKNIEEVSEHDWLFTDECDEYHDELMNNDDLFDEVMRNYIVATYG